MWKKTHKDERGLWNEYQNTQTGEKSIKEHELKVVWKSCKSFAEHNFEVTGNREWQCSKCNFVFVPIIGIHKLENGKIIEKIPPKLEKS